MKLWTPSSNFAVLHHCGPGEGSILTRFIKPILAASLLLVVAITAAQGAEHTPILSRAEREKFDQHLYDAITARLNQLLTVEGKSVESKDANAQQQAVLLVAVAGKPIELKGTSTIVRTALAFCLLGERSGDTRYIAAARDLADRVLRAMRDTKFGVLPAREPASEEGPGGGTPAIGEYIADLAYIFRNEEKREADLKYLSTVVDQLPWNLGGWWPADVDAVSGQPVTPLTLPSPVCRNAALVLASDILAKALQTVDPKLAKHLKARADKCLYRRILPAQKSDGSWPYNLTGPDPAGKDVPGYSLLTSRFLSELQHFFVYDPRLEDAIPSAGLFASKHITPDPALPPRSFQLGVILAASKRTAECIKVIDATLPHLPSGDTGPEGAQDLESCALVLQMLP